MAHWGDDGGGGWRYQISNLEIKIVTFLDYCIYICIYIFCCYDYNSWPRF